MYPNLKLYLWKAGIRQNRMAKAIGVDEALLSKVLNGFRTPGPDLRRHIATYLNCDEEWLFETAEPAPRKAADADDAPRPERNNPPRV